MSISSTEVLQSNKDIRLPVAKEAKDAKENPGQIIVNLAYSPINNGVAISVNDKDYPAPGDLIPVLQNHIQKNPMVRVLIRADKDVRYATMKSLLEAVGKAGIANVTFSVVDKEEAPTPS
jgi:biopolymer transport protein ExbD